MSWRSGSKLFCEMWPLIQANIPDRGHRVDFTARLLKLFEEDDMDTYDVEDVHPDIRAAMRQAGIEVADPDRYHSRVRWLCRVCRIRAVGSILPGRMPP